MNHDVTKTGNTWTYGDTKFWPESTVDFYSYSPMNMRRGTVNITAEGEKKIEKYLVAGDEDFLYALNPG